jgi:molecular chaperone GrpE
MDNCYPNESDTVEISAGAAADTVEESVPAEPEKQSADALAQLQSELDSARQESEAWRERFLRRAAEFENYRKRVEKEKKEWTAEAKASVIIGFLPLMDACERAMGSFEDVPEADPHLQQYRQGVDLLYKLLSSTLTRLGVASIDALGRTFDPNLHEALTRMESMDYEENTVISELRRGYMYQDRLLRPVQVVVASRPSNADDGSL